MRENIVNEIFSFVSFGLQQIELAYTTFSFATYYRLRFYRFRAAGKVNEQKLLKKNHFQPYQSNWCF